MNAHLYNHGSQLFLCFLTMEGLSVPCKQNTFSGLVSSVCFGTGLERPIHLCIVNHCHSVSSALLFHIQYLFLDETFLCPVFLFLTFSVIFHSLLPCSSILMELFLSAIVLLLTWRHSKVLLEQNNFYFSFPFSPLTDKTRY